MKTPGPAGRWIFAVALAGFGAQFLLSAITARIGSPGGPWIALRSIERFLAGVLLLAGGAGIALRKARWPALLIALVLLRVLPVHAVHLVQNPSTGPWTAAFELLGLFGVALVLLDRDASGRLTDAGRWLVAASLVVFGVQHFRYLDFVARFMPAWIPGRLFWAAAAAVGFLSAALCLAAASMSARARQLAPLASTLLGVMYLIFVLAVHVFRIAAAPHTAQEWTSVMVALSWCGASWILARSQQLRFAAR